MPPTPPRAPEDWGADEWDLLGDLPPLGGRRRAEPSHVLPTDDVPGDDLGRPEDAPDAESAEEVIAALVADLNPPQREAVLHEGGPLVVVAGAGSGKTRVLTRRIARLVASGVKPWRILAITFTNKAADEMRRRVIELVGLDAERMWISTFHAACVRMLRRNVDRIGYRAGFSIYDKLEGTAQTARGTLPVGDTAGNALPCRAILGHWAGGGAKYFLALVSLAMPGQLKKTRAQPVHTPLTRLAA